MPNIFEDLWGWRNEVMIWLIFDNYFLLNSPIGWYIKKASTSPNVKCLYIKSMHHIVTSEFWYLMLMDVYIGIHMSN